MGAEVSSVPVHVEQVALGPAREHQHFYFFSLHFTSGYLALGETLSISLGYLALGETLESLIKFFKCFLVISPLYAPPHRRFHHHIQASQFPAVANATFPFAKH
jgi:hypothetical protein